MMKIKIPIWFSAVAITILLIVSYNVFGFEPTVIAGFAGMFGVFFSIYDSVQNNS